MLRTTRSAYLLFLPDNYTQGQQAGWTFVLRNLMFSPKTLKLKLGVAPILGAVALCALRVPALRANLTLNYGLRWGVQRASSRPGDRIRVCRPGQATTIYPSFRVHRDP